MNLYEVVSEQLSTIEPVPGFYGQGPTVYYQIFAFVVAETAAQAKYAAWKSDPESCTGDMRDMPRFSVKKLRANLDVPVNEPTIVTGDEPWIEDVFDELFPEPEDYEGNYC